MLLLEPPAGPEVKPLTTLAGPLKGLGVVSCVLFALHVLTAAYSFSLLQESHQVGPRIGDGLWLQAIGTFETSMFLALIGAIVAIATLCSRGRKAGGALAGLLLNASFLFGSPLIWLAIDAR